MSEQAQDLGSVEELPNYCSSGRYCDPNNTGDLEEVEDGEEVCAGCEELLAPMDEEDEEGWANLGAKYDDQ